MVILESIPEKRKIVAVTPNCNFFSIEKQASCIAKRAFFGPNMINAISEYPYCIIIIHFDQLLILCFSQRSTMKPSKLAKMVKNGPFPKKIFLSVNFNWYFFSKAIYFLASNRQVEYEKMDFGQK